MTSTPPRFSQTPASSLTNSSLSPQANSKKTVINYGKTPFAFDWTTGDILEATKDKDGKYIVKKDKDGKDVKDANGNPVYAEYTVKYHYDKEFDRYFEIKTKADVNGDEKVVGISILDDSDVAELKKAIDKACEEEKVVGQRSTRTTRTALTRHTSPTSSTVSSTSS